MSYTALYRKFRPGTFSGVVGQEHIVRSLKNQIASKRVSHAYLFCGTRGDVYKRQVFERNTAFDRSVFIKCRIGSLRFNKGINLYCLALKG